MQPVRLSAVIITKNEEKNIERCLRSLAEVADEVIVIDGFSTDQTVSIARGLGANVTQREWEGYSASKNFGNGIASADYILSIDADEELSDALKKSIITFKNNPTSDACDLNRLTNYCGKWIRHSGWYPEYKTRIFKKTEAAWTGTIHEELKFKSDPRIQKLSGDLLHFSYPTVESHVKKIYTYASLAAEKDFYKGKRYNLLVHGLMKPQFMFFKKYFLKLGFLDGGWGFAIAMISAFERFVRYIRYRELKENQKR
jgi:glycosyltransferase involved in cell wall biosynthesis